MQPTSRPPRAVRCAPESPQAFPADVYRCPGVAKCTDRAPNALPACRPTRSRRPVDVPAARSGSGAFPSTSRAGDADGCTSLLFLRAQQSARCALLQCVRRAAASEAVCPLRSDQCACRRALSSLRRRVHVRFRGHGSPVGGGSRGGGAGRAGCAGRSAFAAVECAGGAIRRAGCRHRGNGPAAGLPVPHRAGRRACRRHPAGRFATCCGAAEGRRRCDAKAIRWTGTRSWLGRDAIGFRSHRHRRLAARRAIRFTSLDADGWDDSCRAVARESWRGSVAIGKRADCKAVSRGSAADETRSCQAQGTGRSARHDVAADRYVAGPLAATVQRRLGARRRMRRPAASEGKLR